MSESLPKSPQESLLLDRRLAALALCLCLVMGAARLFYAWTEPLWFDEAFTLAVISPTGFATFWREVWLDSNAPGFYLLSRLWTDIAGRSDFALRIPGLTAVAIAAVLPLLYRPSGLSRNAALTWGGLIFLWWGVGMYLDGRCYPVLLALSTLQVLAFVRVLQKPGRAAAWLWTTVSALAILTHYYAGFVVLAQGLTYLASARMAAVKTWPAALAFVPVAGWIVYHAPRLAAYSQPDVAWHPRLTLDSALDQVIALVTNGPAAGLVCIAVLLAISLLLSRREEPAPGPDRALVLAAIAGLAGLAIILATGLLKPTLTSRYLIPTVPSVLLCLILAIRGGKWRNHLYGALLILYALIQVPHALERLARTPDRPSYEFETVSEALAGAGVTDLVFVWDHELAPMMDRGSLARVGGVFVERLRKGVHVTPLVVDREHDPNLAILAAAKGEKPGIIWLYNREGRTASAVFAPAIPAKDSRWTCVRSGDGVVGSVGCHLKP
ncbi:MAG: hypothetical protein CFE28_00895 [Alphaproteobacteria bacterium PA2]|nr:MAG: hypothetical protein CFE28_00895 [Alphaproteobacteria bacterium PA2]